MSDINTKEMLDLLHVAFSEIDESKLEGEALRSHKILLAIRDFIQKHSDPSMVPSDKWKPISTAPRDGVTKALYGCYKDGKWYEQITKRGSGVGGLHVNVPTGFRSYTEATHWMPLPEPPTSSEGGRV